MIPNLRELWEELFLSLDWDPIAMMNQPGSNSVPEEGTPAASGGGSATTAASSKEMLNNMIQSMGQKGPLPSTNERTSPLPEEGTAIQKSLQVNS